MEVSKDHTPAAFSVPTENHGVVLDEMNLTVITKNLKRPLSFEHLQKQRDISICQTFCLMAHIL